MNVRHRGQRGVEQLAGEAVPAGIAGAADDGAERPQRAPVAVFGPAGLEPVPRVGQEVPEAPDVAVEGVTDEGEVARRERADHGRVFAAGVLEKRHQQQRSRVVVEAIAVVVARNAEDGVLQHAGVVGHRDGRASG